MFCTKTHKHPYLDAHLTLASGLGKTFIAAVLMFNFFRWFPKGKVVVTHKTDTYWEGEKDRQGGRKKGP